MDEIIKRLLPDDSAIDSFYDQSVREELKEESRKWLINWSKDFSYAFQMGVYSVVTGRWDDIEKDLRRNKYTLNDAILILDMMLKFKLIDKFLYDYKKEKWSNL